MCAGQIPAARCGTTTPEAKKSSNSSTLDDLKKRGKVAPTRESVRRRFRHRHRSSSSTDGGSVDVPREMDGLENIWDVYGPRPSRSTLKACPERTVNPSPTLRNTHRRSTPPRLSLSPKDPEICVLATCFKVGFELSSRHPDLFVRRLAKLGRPPRRANPFGFTSDPSARGFGSRTSSGQFWLTPINVQWDIVVLL